jgi:putative YphP/YqiW family bacilliredoxin
MPYPEMMVAPMRDDLVRVGFRELRTAEDVDREFENPEGTLLVAVNSVCGCSAGGMRPGVGISVSTDGPRPERLTTVFAGQDMEATERARDHIVGYPPSSPSVALFKDGELVWMLERHQIEGQHPYDIAATMRKAYEQHCAE